MSLLTYLAERCQKFQTNIDETRAREGARTRRNLAWSRGEPLPKPKPDEIAGTEQE